MTECKFCDKEFDSKEDMHLHWLEEHEDELNSHQKDKAKKAEKKRKERREAKKREKKRKLGYGAAGIIAVAFVAFVGMQLAPSSGGSTTFTDAQLEGQPMLGNADANVTIVEFSDHKCPYCREFKTGERSGPNQPANPGVYEQLKENFIDTGQAKMYVINLPLHEGASQIAEATECVYNQDEEQYWDYNYEVYADRDDGGDSVDYLVGLARNTTEGLDYDQLRSCIANGDEASEIERDLRIARGSPGPAQTPKIFINGKYYPDWTYSNLESAIESELY